MSFESLLSNGRWSCLSVCVCLLVGHPASVLGEVPEFESDILPIFTVHCVECHGPNKQKAGLDLSHAAGLARGSDDGPVITPENTKESLLLRLVREGRMPPKESGVALSAAQIQVVTDWVANGAQLPGVTNDTAKLDQHDVQPILNLRCVACHGRQRQEAGLDLRSVAGLQQGSDNGAVVESGDPDASLIIQKIEGGEMPPKRDLVKAGVKVVRPVELKVLRDWIRAGLPTSDTEIIVRPKPSKNDADNIWAFRPVKRPEVPEINESALACNPIDRFIGHRLETAGLLFAPEADRNTLLRRAQLDLLGLVPTLAEQEDFGSSVAPDAYDRLVDRLLASPAYGERWGRFWLDLAGYADSEGIQHADEVRPAAYRYRDYVIQSLNAGKSYRQFLLEQLAGDELVAYQGKEILDRDAYDALVATGFLRMVGDGTNANITNFVPHRLDVVANEMQVLGSSVLGLTVHCARCHSHKFDPLTQRDYYRLLAVFKGAFDEHDWLSPNERRLEVGLADEMAAWRQRDERISREIARVKRLDDFSDEDRAKAIKELESQRTSKPFVRALWDRGEPSDTYLLTRGDYLKPAGLVASEVPEFLRRSGETLIDGARESATGGTGRRLAFAQWLVDGRHPLTARVIVNRVWKHHFGRGLVSTLDNFGLTGSPPTHPDLLDWLADFLVSQDWSLKALHRLIMTSRTYRQTSVVSEQHIEIDPENRLWSRMAMRRLEGEILRDVMLQVSGRMHDQPFGPADGVEVSKEGLVTAVPTNGAWRRSVYILQRRTQVPTLLQSFDLPAMSPNCVERTESTVATQALHLLNNKMIHELSASFADRAVAQGPNEPHGQIRWILATALGRPPTDDEVTQVDAAREAVAAEKGDTLTEQRILQALCHSVFNSAAFIYVD